MRYEDAVEFLKETAKYFEHRPTEGEDQAHWANVYNAENCHKIIKELERLREKCDMQAMILRRLTPENFPDTYFIHGDGGTKDINGMPERIYVVPAYGCDWSQVYERTDKVTGPEW